MCLMEFLTRELDDPSAAPCGRCASCAAPFVQAASSPEAVRAAVAFLKRASFTLEPRKRGAKNTNIRPEHRAEPGRSLCDYGDAGWGTLVEDGKYRARHFSDALVQASVDAIRLWRPSPAPEWVTAVPSLRHPVLVPDFARRLAAALELPYRAALRKVRETPPQNTMENGAHQSANVTGAFEADTAQLDSGAVLLVDDLVDSRWTLTECAQVLREAGSGPVLPFALARGGGDEQE